MRYPQPLLFLLIAGLFCFNRSQAQLNWKWGITTTRAAAAGTDVVGSTVTDKLGNVYVTGVEDGSDSITFGTIKIYNPGTNYQCIVAKADSSGNYVWAVGLQSKGNTQPYSIAADAAGNLYLYGYYANDSCKIGSFTLHRSSFFDMDFLAKFSPAGYVIWAKNVCESGVNGGTIGVDDSDNVYIQGGFQLSTETIGSITVTNTSTAYTEDIYHAKYDSAGNVKWAKSYGGKANEYCSPNPSFLCSPMAVSSSGNSYVTGQSTSDTFTVGTTAFLADPIDPASSMKASYLAEFDNNGNNVWAEKIDRHMAVNAISVDNQGNTYVTGSMDSTVTIGSTVLPWIAGWDVFIAKYDANGNPVWAKSAGNLSKEQGYAISVDQCGKLWVCGQTDIHETITFDGHILTPDPSAGDPLFIVEYDTAGNYLSSMIMPTGGDDMCGIAVDNRGNVFLGGDYAEQALPFGPDTLANIVGGEYFFVAKCKYDSGSCYIHGEGTGGGSLNTTTANTLLQDISLYPNPVTNELTITAPYTINQVTISNLVGQAVFTHAYIDQSAIQVDVACLPAGIYLVRINGAEVRKLVKE